MSIKKRIIYIFCILLLVYILNNTGIDKTFISWFYDIYSKLIVFIIPIFLGGLVSYYVYIIFMKKSIELHTIKEFKRISIKPDYLKYLNLDIIKYKIDLMSKCVSGSYRDISKIGENSHVINNISLNVNNFGISILIIDKFIDNISYKIYINKYKNISPGNLSNQHVSEIQKYKIEISEKIFINDILNPEWNFNGCYENLNLSNEFKLYLNDHNIESFKFNPII